MDDSSLKEKVKRLKKKVNKLRWHGFDVMLEFSTSNQDISDGVVATISSQNPTTAFYFESQPTFEGEGETMEIYLKDVLVMVVDFPKEYIDTNFKYVHEDGNIYYSIFTNNSVNF